MMTLTPEERTLLAGRLAEAEQSLHELMIGQQARVFVDQNGERVEYSMASADRLRAYIASLKQLLGLRTGIAGPLNFWM